MSTYKVKTKSDDYGACITEIVECTEDRVNEYYYFTKIEDADVAVLAKYFDIVSEDEEVLRSEERRFYGNE